MMKCAHCGSTNIHPIQPVRMGGLVFCNFMCGLQYRRNMTDTRTTK